MAGINAHLKLKEKDPFILGRSDAYIGVLIDDLITKGTEEPYRMFTSRAEFRILLRQDNADLRLTQLSHNLGLASDEQLEKVNLKIQQTNAIKSILKKTSVAPDEINDLLAERNSSLIKQKQKANSLLVRPHISMDDVRLASSFLNEKLNDLNPTNEALVQAEIQIKYEGYISREQENALKLNRLEEVKIPPHTDYSKLSSLSAEAVEKLTEIKPITIGQASRISGVSPSDVSILLVYLGR